MLKKLLVIIVASVLMFSCATVAFATGDDTELLPANGYKQGDVNMDSNIDVKDVILVLRHTVELTTLTEEKFLLADVDLNGVVNVRDAIYIQKIIVNIQENPTEKPTVPDEYIEDDKPIELPFVPAG